MTGTVNPRRHHEGSSMTEPDVTYGPHRHYTIRGRYPLGDVFCEDGSLKSTGPWVDRTWIADTSAEVAEVLHDIADDMPQISWPVTANKLHEVAARWDGGTRTADDPQWLQRIGVTITSDLQ